jgi:hypothetical protein
MKKLFTLERNALSEDIIEACEMPESVVEERPDSTTGG